jgi:hypothetical protein
MKLKSFSFTRGFLSHESDLTTGQFIVAFLIAIFLLLLFLLLVVLFAATVFKAGAGLSFLVSGVVLCVAAGWAVIRIFVLLGRQIKRQSGSR